MKKYISKLSMIISIVGLILSIYFFIINNYIFLKSIVYNDIIVKLILISSGLLLGISSSLIIKKLLMHKKKAEVFLSYSSKDEKVVNQLKYYLNNFGIESIDILNQIKVGDDISNKVDFFIKKSDSFLLIISKDSLKSNFIQNELNTAIKLEKKIFPILIDENFNNIPKEISQLKYIDLKNNFNQSVEKLSESIISYKYAKNNA